MSNYSASTFLLRKAGELITSVFSLACVIGVMISVAAVLSVGASVAALLPLGDVLAWSGVDGWRRSQDCYESTGLATWREGGTRNALMDVIEERRNSCRIMVRVLMLGFSCVWGYYRLV